MKNLMTYTPEPFENLEIMDAEYDVLTGEGEMEEGFVRSRGTKIIRRPTARRAGRVPMLSKKMKLVKPFRPKFPMRPLMPAVPVPFPYVPMGSNALTPANNAAADSNRPSAGQSAGSSAGGEGSFANAPVQDVSSEHVRWVQETLNRALGLRLMVDGIMNRETRSAVRMFQERKGLPVTGLVGPDTEEVLRAEDRQAAAEPELLEGEWDMPESGECSCGGREFGELEAFEQWEDEAAQNSAQKVRWIQESLNKILGLRLKIDGIMGPQTRSAIRSFQQKNGLIADGVIGQGTVNALQAALSASGALPPASSTVIATTNPPVLGSSDFRARAIKLLQPLPPYPQEITSNGPQQNLFTQMTGLTQEMLRDAWAKGKNLTSCNAFTGWFSRAMGSKKYLGRFDLDKFASRSWVPASSGRTPKYGDILRFKTFHVGIALDLVDGMLHTAEGGQGGPKRGFDAIKRKQMPWDPSKFMGWVDLEDWIQNDNAFSLSREMQYEAETGIEIAGLGLAVFQAVHQVLTSGDLSVTSSLASYVHQSTPAHIPFKRRSIEFKISAHHPRYGIDRQQFFFSLSFEYNGYDIKNASISVLRSKSSSLYSSTFTVNFEATSDSLPSDAKARIAYSISNGRWDPVGLGDAGFRARPLFILHANGEITIGRIESDENWINFDGFISSTLKDVSLFSGGAGGQTPPPQSGGISTLRIGARGASVTDLQIRLNRWLQSQGRQLLGVDGNFGPRTHRVVLEFQQAAGLKPDGVVGAKTWGILKKYW